MHNDGDRQQHLPYLFLSEAEVGQLRLLATRGIEITAQDLPNSAPVTLEDLL